MAVKTKVTLVVPENLQRELRQHVIKDNYGLRGKSTWVAEAITKLLAMTNYIELVRYGDEMKGFEKVETVVLDRDMKKKLDDAIIAIRKEYPTLEGVQSRIVRTAIVQRLLHS